MKRVTGIGGIFFKAKDAPCRPSSRDALWRSRVAGRRRLHRIGDG